MTDPWQMVSSLQQWDAPAVELGPHTSFQYRNDPKHLAFVLARYKFVAKVLEGMGTVLEVGCGDGFATAIVAQAVDRVVATDTDKRLVEWAREHLQRPDLYFTCGLEPARAVGSLEHEAPYDAVYGIDVIEHVSPSTEDQCLAYWRSLLRPTGTMIIGTPNISAHPWASPSSRAGHINLKSAAMLRALMTRHFHTVFMFGMNDEVVHTGFAPMAHYLWAIGVGVK